MKRIGYLHEQVYDIENIEKADDKARKHKSVRWGILKHDKNRNLFYSLTRYSFPVNFKIRPYVRTKKNRNGCAARLNREIR